LIARSRLPHVQGPQAGEDLAGRKKAVPDYGLAVVVGANAGVGFHKLLDFILNGLL
jgi:hypothetical protein